MGKARIALLAALVFGLIGIASQARAASLTDPGVPHTINLQSVVYDAEGKVTTSESVDMTIRIVDADNNVLFSEAQNGVTVVKGAINVNIGEASGGVPLDILDPSTGIKLIDIEIAGQSPFELMPLGALPYAMWAEKSLTVANDSIGSEQIKNGSIKAEDIDPLMFSNINGQLGDAQLPASAATVAQLNAHITSTAAHNASAIVVSGHFVTFVADDVEEALQKLDAKLVDEIVNRQATSTALATHVSSTAAHGSDGAIVGLNTLNAGLTTKVSKVGDTMTGQLIVTQDPPSTSSADASVRINPTTSAANEMFLAIQDNGADVFTVDKEGDVTVSGTVDGVDVSALSGSVTTISADVSGKVSKSGDTMMGDLNMDSDANCAARLGHTCQVDGVDVSVLKSDVDALKTASAYGRKIYTLKWVTNQDNTSGGKLTGTDALNWSLSGVNTGDGKWVSITRSPIVVPIGCIPTVTGTVSPDVADGQTNPFDYDDVGFLKVTYSGPDNHTIDIKVYQLGNDGEYDINIQIVAIPIDHSTNCSAF